VLAAWGRKYPAIAQSWRRNWEQVIPFFAFAPEVLTILYTTNAIENLNAQVRRAVRVRGHFPSEEAATKLMRRRQNEKILATLRRSQEKAVMTGKATPRNFFRILLLTTLALLVANLPTCRPRLALVFASKARLRRGAPSHPSRSSDA
jgi:Transposase, Mutator family